MYSAHGPSLVIRLAAAVASIAPSQGLAMDKQANAPVVCLEAEEPDVSDKNASGKLLFREILRQAALIAARDENGIATRDQALREDFPKNAPVYVISTSRTNAKYCRLKLATKEDPQTILLEKKLTVPHKGSPVVDYLAVASAAEKLIRSDLMQFWRDQKLGGVGNKQNANVAVPKEITAAIDQMNCLSQFSAIRALHVLQREHGESPETLSALSRAYANLGQLTFLHWNASHLTYQARSLLYAQRAVVRSPNSAMTHWSRAYVLALAGLHQQALDDLAHAEELNQESEAASEQPPWAPLVEALCRYDADSLRRTAGQPGECQELAWLFAYLAVEPGTDADARRLQCGFEALRAVPECLRISASMHFAAGVRARHRTTLQGALAVSSAWAERLAETPGITDELSQVIARFPRDEKQVHEGLVAGKDILAVFERVPEIVDACTKAGERDRTDLSFTALARLVEDMAFVEVANRLDFFRGSLGIPVDGYCATAASLFEEHPYRAYFEVAPLDPRRDREEYWKRLADLEIIDAVASQILLMEATWDSPHQQRIQGEKALEQALQHTDHAAYALSFAIQFAKKKSSKRGRAEALSAVSPHCPWSTATLVRLDWEEYETGAEAIEKEHADRPIVLAVLAREYLKRQRTDDAVRVLNCYVKLSPDAWAFEKLADICLERGDVAGWQDALDEALTHEDYALSHARIQKKLAERYMVAKEWEKALPYAKAAASSGAGWAVNAAAKCHEALEQWAEAEELIRYNSQRYENFQSLWYFWCRKSGHGDLKGARQFADDFFRELENRPAEQDWLRIGLFRLLDNDRSGALAAFKTDLERNSNPFSGLNAALLLDEANDPEQRDAVLKAIADLPSDKMTEYQKTIQRLSEIIGNALTVMQRELDLESIEALARHSKPEYHADIFVVTALYFQGKGDQDRAILFFRRGTDTVEWRFAEILSRVRLRELNAKVEG